MSHPSSPATVSALLTTPRWGDVCVLAEGDPGHRHMATGVTISAGLSLPGHAMRGDVLAVLTPVARTDWRLDVLLRRAQAAGVAAVLLAGVEPLQHGTRALAERLRLVVLGSPNPLEAALAAQQLLTRPQEVQAHHVLRVVAACNRAGPTAEELIREVARELGRPVAMLDRSGHVAAGSIPGSADDHAAVAATLTARRDGFGEARLNTPTGSVVLAAPVPTPGGEPTAWAAATLPEPLAAEESAVIAALAVAATAFGHRLATRRLAVERDARRRAALLGELLNTSSEPSAATRRRAVAAGWALEGWHVAARIVAQGDVDAVGLRADVVAALAAQEVDAVVAETGDGWSAWTTIGHEPSAAEVQTHSGALRRAQRALAETVRTHVGVGRAHPGPTGIARSLAEAADAARLAASRPETGRFLHVDRLGLAQLLLAWTRTDTFQPAARELLRPLDGQPGDLLATLGAYLDAESSVAETAAVLGVHRNTVTARLGRIQQLLTVDLANPEERLALHLACRTVAGGDAP